MLSCRLTIKIKDYFPKTDTIPYSNYICLFSCGEYQGQIPFIPDESKFLQHQIKNISSDIKYKVLILDFNDMTLIGMCEMSIAYKVLNRIIPQNGFIQEQQKKLIIDTKTKRKLFGTVINSGDIFLNIYTEVFLISKNFNEQKIKNSKSKKNHLMVNTPKCYIKYNFALNKSDFSPKSSKNNKSTMVNSNSEKQTLNLSKQEKDKENRTNKNSYSNTIKYQKDNEKKNLRNYSNYNIINNNINFFNKKSEVEIYNNKKNIMDLLQQKKMVEEIVENYNKTDIDEKIEVNGEDDYINSNDNINNNKNLYIKTKEPFMTEQNFNQKFIINNNNKIRKRKNIYNINNNINTNNIKNKINNNEIYNNAEEDEEEENQKFFYYSKNTLSPNGENKNKLIDEEKYNKMSKTLKNKNYVLNPNINLINQNYVYTSKNKAIKLGQIYTKGKINDTMKKNININNNDNNNSSMKSKDVIYQNYLTNTNFNNITNTNNNFYYNYNTNPNCDNYTQNDNNINNYNNYATNSHNPYNNKDILNGTSSKNSEEEEENEDIDRIILEKGAELRNDFHTQIKQLSIKNNYHKNISSLNDNDYSDQNQNLNFITNLTNNQNINYNSRTPILQKAMKYSNNKSLNNYLTQEDVKNNCIKLIDFYSLLNFKLKKICPKNAEITQKLVIFKELLSSELKKKNIITNKLNKNNFIYNLSTNINEKINEKILNLFPKIKKLENTIYQQLFNAFSTPEEFAKFSEFENYDKQTKIFLLLNLARNLVKKYGNISQVYTIKNTVNMKKKKTLKKCLNNYLIIEKEVGDKDYVNLETIKTQKISEYSDDTNKFRVIKEVDEDKEEENDGEEEHGIGVWSEGDEVKEIGDENRDQIIEDVDFMEDNNFDNNNINTNIEKLSSNGNLNENEEEMNLINGQESNINNPNENKEKNDLENYINVEDNVNNKNDSCNINDKNKDNNNDNKENIDNQNEIINNEENKENIDIEQNNKENNNSSKKTENGQNIENIE